jgi:hypothetical protein
MLPNPSISIIADDPISTTHRINCNSFQQNAITTHGDWQYCVFYTDANDPLDEPESGRYVNIARRPLLSKAKDASWETLTLRDYVQTADDGHNTISLGICTGDGTLHLAFDAHCDGLRYRISKPRVVGFENKAWDVESVEFSQVLNQLPGLGIANGTEDKNLSPLREITYPRFLSVGDDLLFECRVGIAGKGSCMLFCYASVSGKWRWSMIGRYLVGNRCSPYLNGLSYEPGLEDKENHGRIHITWTNRHFVEYDDPTGTAHKAQAGPNGPENNADLGYIFSDTGGTTWRNIRGELVGDLRGDKWGGVDSTRGDVLVARVPRNSGIMNQEGQAVDSGCGIMHVLMRDTGSGGAVKWRHSWWKRDGRYRFAYIAEESIPPTDRGSRGKLTVDERNGDVYFVLPGNLDHSLLVGRRRIRHEEELGETFQRFEVIWKGEGYDGEPLIDEVLFRKQSCLSIMTRTSENGRKVVTLDWELAEGSVQVPPSQSNMDSIAPS